MRRISDEGLGLIKSFEGFSSRIYICPAGYPTIGYGHLVRADEMEFYKDGITVNEGDELLRKDALSAEMAVLKYISVPLSDGEFDSLVSFTFNLGSGALQSSTLRRKLNRGDYAGASGEFKRWVWAGGRKLSGLIRRRRAESNMFLSLPLAVV